MKIFLTIYCVFVATFFIAIPIVDQETGKDDPIVDSALNKKSPHEESPKQRNDSLELDDLEFSNDNTELAMSKDQFDEVTKLCANYCKLSHHCNNLGYDVPPDGGYSTAGNKPIRREVVSTKRSGSELAFGNLSANDFLRSTQCTGSTHFYKIFTKELLEAANQCKREAFDRITSDLTYRSEALDGVNCCQNCVAKMNSQYRLATECGEKLEKLILCLASSRSCVAQQIFFSSERDRVPKPNSPEYPCQECVLAFKYACGKG